MTQRTIVATLNSRLPYMHEQFGVKKLALFGSFAAGTAGKRSDVDLFIEFDRPVGLKFMRLAEYLEKLLGRKVEVLTPEGLKGIRAKTVADSIRKGMRYV
ncbi:MAG: nucleotidyltransferase family protein [Elusimicrobia bacterium]|nr:nucleotidyltransferase family protein [Elusimicrobiota bacterium]